MGISRFRRSRFYQKPTYTITTHQNRNGTEHTRRRRNPVYYDTIIINSSDLTRYINEDEYDINVNECPTTRSEQSSDPQR